MRLKAANGHSNYDINVSYSDTEVMIEDSNFEDYISMDMKQAKELLELLKRVFKEVK